MRVRVELVIRGQELNPTVDIYEVFPTGCQGRAKIPDFAG